MARSTRACASPRYNPHVATLRRFPLAPRRALQPLAVVAPAESRAAHRDLRRRRVRSAYGHVLHFASPAARHRQLSRGWTRSRARRRNDRCDRPGIGSGGQLQRPCPRGSRPSPSASRTLGAGGPMARSRFSSHRVATPVRPTFPPWVHVAWYCERCMDEGSIEIHAECREAGMAFAAHRAHAASGGCDMDFIRLRRSSSGRVLQFQRGYVPPWLRTLH